MDSEETSILARMALLKSKIAQAASDAHRSADDICLVAVSKVQPDHRLEAALVAGQRVFGENRVQEAQSHWAHRRSEHPDLELHLIGPLQTNKVSEACALFDVIETLDRDKLAHALAREGEKRGSLPRLWVQVNTGEEPQKAGIAPLDLPRFLNACVQDYGLKIEGLMCIPPVDENPAMHFALLHKLATRHGLPHRSMGMSEDFECAIRLGATHVRIGSALFGPRDPTT
jgi:PLP dependent protein